MKISYSLLITASAALFYVRPIAAVGDCGCSSCTSSVLNQDADGYSVRDRIDWVVANMGESEREACTIVCGDEFSSVCGDQCDPNQCSDSGGQSKCGCSSCTPSVLGRNADGYSVGNRIDWVVANMGQSEQGACSAVCGDEFPDVCGECNPTQCGGSGGGGSKCGCSSCTDSVLGRDANGYSVGSRIDWLVANTGQSEQGACSTVCKDEFPSICGECNPSQCGGGGGGGGGGSGGTVKAMSYNTEYKGYWDGRLPNFARHIVSIGADVVGLQECQDSGGIASATGYSLLAGSSPSGGNTILYNGDRLQALSSGYFNIPRDDFAQRTISWGKFRIIQGSGSGSEFWFFNTHLPHNHNQAADPNTHSRIAKMLLDKRAQLGAGNSPTIVTGDCNPFASAGASEGSFEQNLAAGGINKVYQATGSTGGFAGLDKIFASRAHWSSSNADDVGTGSSDHPAIVVDLTL